MPDQIPQLIDPMIASAKAWIGTTEGVLTIVGSMVGMGLVVAGGVKAVGDNTALAQSAEKTALRAERINDQQAKDIRAIEGRLVTLEVEVRNNTKAINNLSEVIGDQPDILVDRFEALLERKGVIK